MPRYFRAPHLGNGAGHNRYFGYHSPYLGSRRSARQDAQLGIRAGFLLDFGPDRSGAPQGIGRRNQGKLASFPKFLADFSRRHCEPLHTSRFGDQCETAPASTTRSMPDFRR